MTDTSDRRDRFRLAQLLQAIEHDRLTPEVRALVDVPGLSAADYAVQALLAGNVESAHGIGMATLARRYLAVDAGTVEAAAWAAAITSRDAQVLDAAGHLKTPTLGATRVVRLGRAIVDLPHSARVIAAVECEVPDFAHALRHAANPARTSGRVLEIIRGMVTARQPSEIGRWRERASYLIGDTVPERMARVLLATLTDDVVGHECVPRDLARDYVKAGMAPAQSQTRQALCVLGLLVDDEELQTIAADARFHAPENLRRQSAAAGARVVQLAIAGKPNALELIEEVYPMWAELLAQHVTSHNAARHRDSAESRAAEGA